MNLRSFVEEMQMESSNRPREAVIVRSWGDEPVRLFVYRIENNGHTVFVGPDSELGRPIGLPSDQVLIFDEDAFSALRSAYERADFSELSRIYSHCIKYQNKVDSYA
jgi:hypothetical protein